MANPGEIILKFFIHPEALDAARTGQATGIIIAVDYGCLLVASVVGLAVIIERLIRTRRKRFVDDQLLGSIEQDLQKRDLAGAVAACQGNQTVLGVALAAELEEYRQGNAGIEEAVETAGDEVENKMNANLDILSSIAKIAPLLGLLGTVLGMMYAFGQLDLASKKETLAHGITTALDTTVRGLIIAILCLTSEGYFIRRIDRLTRELNVVFTKMIRVSRRRSSPEDSPQSDKTDEDSGKEEQEKKD
ncbi:MAG: MotA/TolQ/ExbB proton channel family protein [Planctomycetota bacterium]|jgi:biopolymer transport protein ExbB|nr:MotA/TolQ/ExbB proton channel family protein [Planctomycetota bacterium]